MVSETILSVQALSKNFGKIKAVDKLSLEIKRGQVFGILGPNGSGKTTTLGIVLGLIKPQSGDFKWFGKPISSTLLRNIGSILETPLFYPYLSATDNLKIIADIKQVDYQGIDEKLKLVGLYDRRNHAFKTYSLGMKQRLAIAAALLGNPEVLILDEPTNGLDPQGIAEIRDLIKAIALQGKTIILASHLLDEVQKVCTDVAVLQNGQCLFTGKVETITSQGLAVEAMAEHDELLKQAIESCAWAKIIDQQQKVFHIQLDSGHLASDLNRYLLEHEVALSHLTTIKKTLERHFLELLKN
ncbi:MAG: ATP-binding cassette domain-containing protein [Bacteroidetes bacterium]|nr:ATP-binding cassette domain-containing protein [Bacteroidota bacterium]MBU1580025.1 ATP-binding cassette domain-containing protein [Bacteroidota bacterium]MBU2559169.1 ATP-binding cassette domain-containing protein [Bacteroidota bacterium]